MHTQAAIHDLVRTLVEERLVRSIAAYDAGRARARGDCPLERLARWIVSRRGTTLDPALLAR